jgi:hypothetical protein
MLLVLPKLQFTLLRPGVLLPPVLVLAHELPQALYLRGKRITTTKTRDQKMVKHCSVLGRMNARNKRGHENQRDKPAQDYLIGKHFVRRETQSGVAVLSIEPHGHQRGC